MSLLRLLAFTLPLAALLAPGVRAQCPTDIPSSCAVNTNLGAGRWYLSNASGIAANVTAVYPGEEFFIAAFEGGGPLSLSRTGGPDANFIDVACDGTVTGQGSDRISGIVTVDPLPYDCVDPDQLSNAPPDLVATLEAQSYELIFVRDYTISGNVSGSGTVELDYTFTSVTVESLGDRYEGIDGFCTFTPDHFDVAAQDITGNVPSEQVTLSGTYDSATGVWQPTLTDRGSSWLATVAQDYYEDEFFENEWDVQGTAAITPAAISFSPDSQTVPVITAITLTEPSQYLLAVTVNTEAQITTDWGNDAPGNLEITYNGATVVVPGANTVNWPFAAGDGGMTISVVAVRGDERSGTYTVSVPKVQVPPWAGTAGDWAGASGIRYTSSQQWPVPNALDTLSGLQLFNGTWGVQSAASTLELVANSDGAPGTGTLDGGITARFAGRDIDFPLSGSSETTLSCDALSMSGTAQFPELKLEWSDTVTLGDLVPGLEPAVCSVPLLGILCRGVRSLTFAEGHASLAISGSGDFEGTSQNPDIRWTGGTITGDIGAGFSIGAIPRELNKVAELQVTASGEGCLDLDVAPDFMISQLGITVDASAKASLFGVGVSLDPAPTVIGDSCSAPSAANIIDAARRGLYRGKPQIVASSSADDQFEIPGDGQPSAAFNPAPGASTLAAAVWRAEPASGDRPGGSISLRLHQDGRWSVPIAITDDAPADLAPAVAFDANGDVLVVYQRNASAGAIPTNVEATPAFANGLELHFAVVDPATQVVTASGVLTDNTLADLGHGLRVDAAGNVHLFWQRNAGIELLGTNDDPVTILTRYWNGSTWSAETTAIAGLVGHFGWYPAVWDTNTAFIATVLDTDDDLATSDDRDLAVTQRSGGIWGNLAPVTDDDKGDHSPIGAYAAGSPQLLWVNNGTVYALGGALPGIGDPLNNPITEPSELVGFGFGDAAIQAEQGLDLLWPEGTTLRSVSNPAGAWGEADVLASDGNIIKPLAVFRTILGQQIRAEVEQIIETDGNPAPSATIRLLSPDGGLEEPPTVPPVPTIVRVDAGDGELNIVVSSNGGGNAEASQYEATCSDGTNSITGSSNDTRIVVGGLTNGTTYTCTVTASNGVGTSGASAPSAAVTPIETSGGGLPAWLIYSATKDD